jgi:divalent metal cation (Fe/Co/Zn/Cd) transporter
MFAAFGIFTAGAIVSIVHGYQQLFALEKDADFLVNYIVLAVAAVLEGISSSLAYRQARTGGRALGKSTGAFALTSSNATLRAVFAEDAAALVGLVVAFLGILLHQLTGLAIFDAIGSILIGVLLGIVAVVLIDRNRRFLVGQIPDADLRNELLAVLLERPQIDKVTYLHLEFVGPGRLFVVAAVDFIGNEVETQLAVLLRVGSRQARPPERGAGYSERTSMWFTSRVTCGDAQTACAA